MSTAWSNLTTTASILFPISYEWCAECFVPCCLHGDGAVSDLLPSGVVYPCTTFRNRTELASVNITCSKNQEILIAIFLARAR